MSSPSDRVRRKSPGSGSRVEHEIERNQEILKPDALAEFEQALTAYRQIEQRALPEFKGAECEQTYPQHLQGICTDQRESLYWSFTTRLVRTDQDGRIQRTVNVRSHHGDLCYRDGRLYVAVNYGDFNNPKGNADSWVCVYDADTLELLQEIAVPDVRYGAGGIGYHNQRFVVVGGLPDNANRESGV